MVHIPKSTTTAVLLLLTSCSTSLLINCHAFSQCSHKRISARSDGEWYLSSLTDEASLREELRNKNENVSVGKDLAVMDGQLLSAASDEEEEVVSLHSDENENYPEKTKFEKELERAKKPRAYPLFLLEKGLMLVEDVVSGLLDFDDGSIIPKKANKERIVVLGTGWGAASFLKEVDIDSFDVTVISPRNYFLFTPMLAGASVGTVEYRSISEPVREINRKVNYIEATATEIDPKTRKVTCESVMCEGTSCTIEDFDVEYDRLIVGVGAQTNTFGIPGVRENCCFLKQVDDARRIRNGIVNCFERANLPSLSDEEKKKALTFAVIGAGPTGIEFASELRDFIEQDGPKYYPNLLKYVSIKVIEASNTILAPFDKSLQEEAIGQFLKPTSVRYDSRVAELIPNDFKLTELLLESGVKEVTTTSIYLNNGEEIPYGLSVWAAGVGPLPITLELIDILKDSEEQSQAQSVARGRLAIDSWLRVLGTDGSLFAFGDCSCNINQPLPATAQVASQQGEYLARLLKKGDLSQSDEAGNLVPVMSKEGENDMLSDKVASFAMLSSKIAAPFQFLNLGILAYTGSGTALSQVQVTSDGSTKIKGKGKIGFGLWRSVYLSKQVSGRNRALVLSDWIKTQLFGRDITRIS